MLIDTTFTLECPKCGKKSLVKRQDDLYQCLSCDFKKDFNQPEANSVGSIIAAIVVLILLLVTIGELRATSSCASNDFLCIEQERSRR